MMGGFGAWGGLWVIVYLLALGFPIARVLGRVGFSPWWTIVAFIPLVNVIFLWVFAYGSWPNEPR